MQAYHPSSTYGAGLLPPRFSRFPSLFFWQFCQDVLFALSAVIFAQHVWSDLVSRSSASSGPPWSPDDRQRIDASWSSWMARHGLLQVVADASGASMVAIWEATLNTWNVKECVRWHGISWHGGSSMFIWLSATCLHYSSFKLNALATENVEPWMCDICAGLGSLSQSARWWTWLRNVSGAPSNPWMVMNLAGFPAPTSLLFWDFSPSLSFPFPFPP